MPPISVSVAAECWGAGQAGDNGTGNGGAGAGYAKKNTLAVTLNTPVSFTLGAPGTVSAQAGGNTFFSSAATVLAPGGASGTSAIGDVIRAGGAGGAAGAGITTNSAGAGGGGGAGGPTAPGSVGGAGGAAGTSQCGGGGGGGAANGGGAGSAGVSNGAPTANGGAGGGAAGGAGGTVGSPSGGVGGLAAGGGGAFADITNFTGDHGGAGGDDYDHGGGGGGGAATSSGASDGAGANGGTPGGGGTCPGGIGSIIGRGGYGLIKLVYTGADNDPDQTFFVGIGGAVIVFRDFGAGASGRGFSSGFSSGFGPAPNSSDGFLAFGSTVSRDYASPIEPRPSTTVSRDFGAAGARPWSSAFSSAFGPTVPGDGSLAFSATVSRDFGTLGVGGPWSSAFSSAFGPFVPNDGSLAFSSTVLRDYAPPIEPRGSAGQSIVIPAAIDSSTNIVTSGPVPAVEWLSTISSPFSVAPIEWRSTGLRDASVFIETRAQFVADQSSGIEWGLSARRDDTAAIDFNMSRLADTLVSVDWRAPLLRDDMALVEELDTVAWTTPVPVEWSASAIIATAITPLAFDALRVRDDIAPAEELASARGDAVVPIDFSQPAQMSTNFTVPMEFGNRIFQVYPEPIEFNTARARDATIPAEWTGNTGTTRDVVAPIEWRGAWVADTTAPTEWRVAFTTDAAVPTEATSVILTDPETAPEMTLSILGENFVFPDADAGVRTEDAVGSAEFGTTLLRDAVVPTAITGSATGAMGDATAPLAFGGGLGSAPWPISAEFGGAVAADMRIISASLAVMLSEPETVAEVLLSVIGENFIVPDGNFDVITANSATPIEWSSVAVARSATFGFEYSAVTTTDIEAPTDWFGTSISADTIALIEWTQDTTGTFADAEASIDFLNMSVLVDVVVPIERDISRHSIGAGLEPDEWEREHE